jgi:hypothetical protein
MRSKSLIVLAALVVVLGAFITFVERHQPTSEERRERADRVFPDLDIDDIAVIDLQTSHGHIRLVDEDGGWRLTDPVTYPADGAAVLGLLEAVADLDADRVLRADEVDPTAYGLDDPEFEVVLIDGDDHRYQLEVGGTTPLGAKRAVRRGDDSEIVLCAGSFVSRLDLPVDDWRSREVVSLAESDISTLDIVAGNDHIRVERVDGRWWLTDPLSDLADRDQIRNLISELNGLRVSEFLPSDTDPAALGLDPPEFRVRLETGDGVQPVTLELAAPDDDSAAAMVCRRNGDDLFRASGTIRPRLAKAPVLWRSAAVWPFNTWDVTAATFVDADGDEVAVEQVDGVWHAVDGSTVDGAEVRRRLSRLAELEAGDHDLMRPPTGVVGRVGVTVGGESGPDEVSFTFFAPIEDGGHAAVEVSRRDDIMGVDGAVAETIVGDLDALRATDTSTADE